MKANPYINPVPTKDGQVLGYVHSLETFGAVDGPGIRFVAFMQGCNMRCKFCHNPDTWKISEPSREVTVDEMVNEPSFLGRRWWDHPFRGRDLIATRICFGSVQEV